MAIINGVTVAVEQHEDGTNWRALKETESDESLKPYANSSKRLTTVLESKPGPFRFVVTVGDKFEWGNANGLRITLTFDEGWTVNEYPVFLLKPGIENRACARRLGYDIMLDSASDSMRFILDSIALPLVMSESDDSWYSTSFVFQRIQASYNPRTSTPRTASSHQAHLRLDVQPCLISEDNRPRPTVLKYNEDNEARNRSRANAMAGNITLETELYRTTAKQRDRVLQHKWNRKGSSAMSFIFCYREIGQYRRIDDVEVVNKAKSRLTPKNTPRAVGNTSLVLAAQTPRFPGLARSQSTHTNNPRPDASSEGPAEHPADTIDANTVEAEPGEQELQGLKHSPISRYHDVSTGPYLETMLPNSPYAGGLSKSQATGAPDNEHSASLSSPAGRNEGQSSDSFESKSERAVANVDLLDNDPTILKLKTAYKVRQQVQAQQHEDRACLQRHKEVVAAEIMEAELHLKALKEKGRSVEDQLKSLDLDDEDDPKTRKIGTMIEEYLDLQEKRLRESRKRRRSALSASSISYSQGDRQRFDDDRSVGPSLIRQ